MPVYNVSTALLRLATTTYSVRLKEYSICITTIGGGAQQSRRRRLFLIAFFLRNPSEMRSNASDRFTTIQIRLARSRYVTVYNMCTAGYWTVPTRRYGNNRFANRFPTGYSIQTQMAFSDSIIQTVGVHLVCYTYQTFWWKIENQYNFEDSDCYERHNRWQIERPIPISVISIAMLSDRRHFFSLQIVPWKFKIFCSTRLHLL